MAFTFGMRCCLPLTTSALVKTTLSSSATSIGRGISKRFITHSNFKLAGAARAPDSTGTSSKISRFYKDVGVVASATDPEWFHVTLDGRNLRTPQKTVLTLPCETLASMVAQEWDSQKKHIETSNMHLTSLCNTAQDKPDQKSNSQVGKDILEFLYTDTVSFREAEPFDLFESQNITWDPIVEWFNTKHNVVVPVTTNIIAEDMTQEHMEAMEEYVSTFNDWALCGLQFATITAKSFVIADALLSGQITGVEAANAARVEVIFQISRFGEVEWAHPMEAADTTARLAAAAVFTQLVIANKQLTQLN